MEDGAVAAEGDDEVDGRAVCWEEQRAESRAESREQSRAKQSE